MEKHCLSVGSDRQQTGHQLPSYQPYGLTEEVGKPFRFDMPASEVTLSFLIYFPNCICYLEGSWRKVGKAFPTRPTF